MSLSANRRRLPAPECQGLQSTQVTETAKLGS